MTTHWQNALRVWRKLTAADMAKTELQEAELQLLEAYSQQEYAASVVQYHEARVRRLGNFLKEGWR